MKSLKYDFYTTNKYVSLLVFNNTGSNITSPKVLKLSSYNSTNDIPEVTPVTSVYDIPLGITDINIPTGERADIIRTGIINNVNTSTASLLDPIYFDSSGNLTLTSSNSSFLGYVIQVSNLGKVFIDIPYYVFQLKQNNLTTPYTTISTSGSIDNLDTTNYSKINLSGASSLSGIVKPLGAKNTLILNNTNSTSLTIKNLSTSSSDNQVLTGTGSDLTLSANASILLYYDLAVSKWKIIGGSGSHNSLTGINGGSPYYHSDQEINIASSPSFAGLTVAGFTLPTTDGSANFVLTTNGSKGLSYSQVSHSNLSNLLGGGSGNYYHSNQEINTTNSPTFAGLTITGDLTVSGNTTTVNTVDLIVKDKNIEIGKVTSPTDVTADLGGITLKGTIDKTIKWVNATTSWTSSENFDLASGRTYKINGTDVLSSTQVLGKSLPSGTIVGTSDSQTLTTKTISVDDNTISGISASSFVLSNASGNIDGSASQKVIPSGVVVGTTDSQVLTNKTISVDDNTVSGIVASSFVLSNSSGNIDGSASQKAIPTGVVVGTTDSQVLTNKTISVDDNTVSGIAVNSFVLSNASGNLDGSASQKVIPTGVVVGTTDEQTLTNKTLTTPIISSITNTGTLTLPTSTDTLIGRNTTDTLTNKTLIDSSTIISDVSDTTIQVKFNASGSTSTSTTIQSSQTVNRTITLPDATTTLIGNDTSDTLTNKTISVDSNTISGIALNSFVLSNGSGNLDGSASQKAIPSGVVVGTTDSQVLTNKTISVDDNTVSGIVASSFVLSNASGNIDGSASQKVIPSGVFVGTTDSQTLTNKTLIDNSTIIADVTDTTIQVKFNASGSTSTSTTIQSSQTVDRTVTLPNATTTLIGNDTSDTLTNKTLQGVTVTGDITSTGTAIDFDLLDNNASALSFDATGKTGILEIDTTDSSEKVKMSGGLSVTGTSALGSITATGTISLNSLTFPSSDGTSGQAIITNGSGVLSFTTISGGGGGSAGLTYQVTSTPLGTLKLGMPVYWNGTTYAPANASTNSKIPTAVVKEINANDYTVQFGGTLTLTNTQWNQITGGSGGLSTSSGTNSYYLSDVTDGQISNVSPIFSIPVLNCIKNDATNSTVEIKFGNLSSTLTNESYSREREVFTANGSTSTFTLTLTPYSRNTTMVSIDGVLQQSNAFSISNKNIVLSENAPANSEIEVNYVTQKNLNYANITKYTETTATSKTAFTLPVTPNSESEVMAWVGGSYQDNSNFTLNGNVLTFDTAVDSGVKVQFVIFSSVQFTDFPFIKRKSITISNSGTKTLIDAFANQSSGRYDFHVIANPLIGGTVRLQETDPINVRVETFSTDISSTASTSSKLNIYINGSGNLEFQNLLGSSITLMLERHQ